MRSKVWFFFHRQEIFSTDYTKAANLDPLTYEHQQGSPLPFLSGSIQYLV